MSVMVKEPAKCTIRGEEIDVFDPPFRKVVQHSRSIVSFMGTFKSDQELSSDDMLAMLEDDTAYDLFCVCASTCTNRNKEFFLEITLTEAAALITIMADTIDWESLKKLFQKVVGTMTPTEEKE